VRPFGLAIIGEDLFIGTDGNSLGQREPGGAIWKMRLAGGTPTLVGDDVGRPRALAALPDGRLAVADYQSHTIRLLSPSNGTLTPLAGGQNAAGFADASGAEARFNQPYDLVVADGALLVSDLMNHRIRRVTFEGAVTTFAGTGSPGMSNGDKASAMFNGPQGLAIDASGNLFVTDTGNYLIRQILPGGEVVTVAGDGSPGYKDSTSPAEAQIFGLEGVDIDPTGTMLYIADGNRGNDGPYHRVRRCTLD
jgi:sugar lactone lactonase YvrE